ncbi:three-Cys-motif partner protein TcmP [Lewinella sp. IMCC34183]|uniref:three-Cys-motif partner protein TcmP n=1 Tax=Lewinella sp. IMCC34183 TaxID=2248762 RepID=UPI000E25A1FF|nr:three-Cys-motif partner protein TcmP [Lewinella sp. IMCC34183]
MKRFEPLIEVLDDDLYIPEVRRWSEEKYNLLGAYMEIFTRTMSKKWSNLVYIDMFAGAGYAKIKSTGKILKSSALIAMSLPINFNTYIFCEADENRFKALQARVTRDYSDKNVILIHGDVNDKIEELKSHIPRFSRKEGVLSFAFVDPFSLNLKFSTIATLGRSFKVDFLILLALGMDANRNFHNYMANNSQKISDFLGENSWAEEAKSCNNSKEFIRYLAEKYDSSMVRLNYKEPEKKQLIKSHSRNLALYYLAFYSKHPLGNKFWKEMQKYTDNQLGLF